MNITYLIIFFFGCFLFTLIERYLTIPFAKWIFIIPFCLIVSNRSIEVPDTEAYVSYFSSEDSSLNNYEDSSFEVGFQTYTKLIKLFVGENVVWYFAIITLTNLMLINFSLIRISKIFKKEQDTINIGSRFEGVLQFVKNSGFTILPLTLYVAYFGLYFNVIVLRVGIALSLVVLTSSFAIKEEKTKLDYILIIGLLILGYLFHATAIIGCLLIFIILLTKELAKKTYLWIWFFVGFVYLTNLASTLGNTVFSYATSVESLNAFSSKLSLYEGEVIYEFDKIAMKFLFLWIMAFILIRNGFSSKIYYKYLNVYMFGLVCYSLFRSVLLVERVTDYFLLFSVVVFYLFLSTQKTTKFWLYYISIVLIQLVFVLRITNKELI